MKEFKVFIASVVVFFVLWIALTYLFAGTIVLISGFLESLYNVLINPVVFCLSFIGGITGAIFFCDNYFDHLKNKK